MISPYEIEISKLAQNTIEVIGTCQNNAEQEGVEIIAYALEHARTSVLNMVGSSTGREKQFESFVDLIAESLGANKTHWRKQWHDFQNLPSTATTHSTFTEFYNWIESDFDGCPVDCWGGANDARDVYLGSAKEIKNSWQEFQDSKSINQDSITEWCEWIEKNDSEDLVFAPTIQSYWDEFLMEVKDNDKFADIDF